MQLAYKAWRDAVDEFAELERLLHPHPEAAQAMKAKPKCRGCGRTLPPGRTSFCRESCRAVYLERDGVIMMHGRLKL